MKCAIWDSFKNICKLKEKMEMLNLDVDLCYMWIDDASLEDCIREGLNCVSYQRILELWDMAEIDAVIISAEKGDQTQANNIWGRIERLKNGGIGEIYVIPATLEKMPIEEMSEYDRNNFLVKEDEFTEPVVVKWLAFEGCNLNCSGCSHFAPINKEPKMLTIDELRRDLLQFKNKFHYIKNIEFLGGEPLLNKDIGEFVKEAHAIFPYANIMIITNGLLIPTLKEEVLEAFSRCNVRVSVSLYEETDKLLNEIKVILEKYKIRLRLPSAKEKFRIQYNTVGSGDYVKNWYSCGDSFCHTIVNGKIAGCYYAVTVKHANAYFGLEIPHEEYEYDIYDEKLSAAEIIKKITVPTNLCSYCNCSNSNTPFATWKKAGKEKNISDWFVDK